MSKMSDNMSDMVLRLRPRHESAVVELYPMVVEPGCEATSVVEVTEIFRPDYLTFERPKPFVVLDVNVGVVPQFPYRPEEKRAEGIPAEQFNRMFEERLPVRFDTCQEHVCLSVRVRNVSPEPARLAGLFIGWKLGSSILSAPRPLSDEELARVVSSPIAVSPDSCTCPDPVILSFFQPGICKRCGKPAGK